jgi:hypothetical protein
LSLLVFQHALAKILIVIIIVAVVSVGFGVGYYLAIRPAVPSTTPSPSPLQTATPTSTVTSSTSTAGQPISSPVPPQSSSAAPTPTPSAPPLALDGSGSSSGAGNAVVSLTTTHANDILYLSVATESNGEAPTIASTPILTWTQRAVATYTNGVRVYTFYAVTASNGVFSITLTTEDSNLAVVVFGVSGSNTASPFDTASPSTNSGVSNSASASISTSNANDFIIGTLGVSVGSSLTVTKDSSFTLILTQAYGITTNGARQTSDEYKIVSATGTYTPTYSLSGYYSWVMIADAIKKTP